MTSKLFILFIAIFYIDYVDARYRSKNLMMNTDMFCSCSELVKAREYKITSNKLIKDIIEVSEGIITIKNCPNGHEFKYDDSFITGDYANVVKNNIVCTKCRENYYRNENYTMCRHCPVGYYSNAGDTECTKADINTKNIHSYCNEGSIIGNDKFADVYDSCHLCSANNKEYMSIKNIMDKCLICPAGSVVNKYADKCTECPVGTYEKDNICHECNIGTYSDKTNSINCNVCDNSKSFSYSSSGGTNCDDSIFYDITKIINNNVVNMDMLIKPIAYGANMGFAAIYNNRKILGMLTHATIPIVGVVAFVAML